MIEKNTAFKIWKTISNNNKVVIGTHISTDGDTIGSAIAIKKLIELNLEGIDVKISGEDYPPYLSFLENNDEVSDSFFKNALQIVVDTSTKSRIHDQRFVTSKAIKIDHHHKVGDWLLEIGGDHWPATGQVIVEMIQLLNLKINFKIKESLFVSIYTDTEAFSQRITDDSTKNAIDYLGLTKQEKDDIINKMVISKHERSHISKLSNEINHEENFAYLVTNDEVPNDYYRQAISEFSNSCSEEVFLCIVKYNDSYRGGIRSKGNIDVSHVAEKFGGGGHFSASGFRLTTLENVEEYISQVRKLVD